MGGWRGLPVYLPQVVGRGRPGAQRRMWMWGGGGRPGVSARIWGAGPAGGGGGGPFESHTYQLAQVRGA